VQRGPRQSAASTRGVAHTEHGGAVSVMLAQDFLQGLKPGNDAQVVMWGLKSPPPKAKTSESGAPTALEIFVALFSQRLRGWANVWRASGAGMARGREGREISSRTARWGGGLLP